MKKRDLPARPSLEQLKVQAKELLQSYRATRPGAFERVRDNHPAWARGHADRLRPEEFSLSEAQLVLAREYGFESWPKLKARVEGILIEHSPPFEVAKLAFQEENPGLLRALLQRHPDLKARLNEPRAECFDAPPITMVRSREMLDVLLEAGADLNARSRWWAGGFGLLHQANPELARYAIERGAEVDIHAAARLGMLDRVRQLAASNPALVRARGGDGQTPLHFAATPEIAEFLLDQGAEMDARDLDHESTPAQYMLEDRTEVARVLVQRGCQTDIFMAAALGDVELALRHLEANPECVRLRVSEDYFPMAGGRNGGTIYQWALGWHVSPHQVAKRFGHERVFQLLHDRSPPEVQLINAAWMEEEGSIESLLATSPNLAQSFDPPARRQTAHAARNNQPGVLRLMVNAGFPVNARGQHGGTPLHWAAWHGNLEMIKLLLEHRPELEDAGNDFHSTPLGWAIHGSENSWHRETGDYAGTVAALLEAGAIPPPRSQGTEAVQEVLRGFTRR